MVLAHRDGPEFPSRKRGRRIPDTEAKGNDVFAENGPVSVNLLLVRDKRRDDAVGLAGSLATPHEESTEEERDGDAGDGASSSATATSAAVLPVPVVRAYIHGDSARCAVTVLGR
uniref:Uncharacterized protein n=1 Tax=Vespula pensylvanica TaxID=30213 RepID=A0A834PH55_VESPE|nr:hypothetical protein H0235_002035 [Vespula pensylvanica]